MGKLTVLSILVVAMFFGTMFAFPGGFSPVEEAEAEQVQGSIVLSTNVVYADVEPGKHGVVSVSGIVDVAVTGAGTNVQVVIVSLTGSSGMGWPVTISPSTIPIKPESNNKGTGAFTATVTVPPKTSYKVADMVTITGRAVAFPGLLSKLIPETTFTVQINQFYRFVVSADKPYKEISPGDQTAFTIHIKNDGNGDDKYRLEIPELKSLSDKGWVVTLQQYDVEIEESKEASLVVTVNTPQEWHMWINEPTQFRVRVQSEQAITLNKISLPNEYFLTVRQRGFSTPGFDPMFMILAIAFIAAALSVQMKAGRISVTRRR